jgi:hypothetical protein
MRTSTSFHEASAHSHGGGAKHSASADNTPVAGSRTSASFAQPSAGISTHHRSATTFSSGMHPALSPPAGDPGDESEEKKRARLEAAERSRLQKKNDAAKAAKASEDKIMLSFSMH